MTLTLLGQGTRSHDGFFHPFVIESFNTFSEFQQNQPAHTFVVHLPVVLPDGVVVRAGRRSDGEVGGHAAHDRSLHLWEGNPAARGTDRASRTKRPEARAVEVVDGAHQGAHLYGVDFLAVSLQALWEASLEVPAGVGAEFWVEVVGADR